MQEYREPNLAPLAEPPRLGGFLFPLAVEVRGDLVVVATPRSNYYKRGVLFLTVIPPLLLVLALMVIGGATDGKFDFDVATLVAVLFAIGLVGMILFFALAGVLSRRTETIFDRRQQEVRKGVLRVPFSHVQGIRVRSNPLPIGIGSLLLIEVWAGNRVVFNLHPGLQSTRAAPAAAIAEYCSQVVNTHYEGPPPLPANALPFGVDDKSAVTLCYLPFQGIHVIASIYYLLRGRHRPHVVFAAKQSLTQTAFTIVASGVAALLFGVPIAILEEGVPQTIFIVLLVASLVVLAIMNLAAHVIALVRGQKGVAWAIPWLRPIVTKWLPPSTSQ